MHKLILAAALAAWVAWSGCDIYGGGSGGLCVTCEAKIACEISGAETCAESCQLFEVTSECVDQMLAASCEEHAMSSPPYDTTCFPPCEPATEQPTCIGSVLHECKSRSGKSGSQTVATPCAEFCTQQGRAYTGWCGSEYNGEVSPSGYDECWCYGQGIAERGRER